MDFSRRLAEAHLMLEKHFIHFLSIQHVYLCPTLDLVAIITSPTTVEVFRFTGHRAFGLSSNNEVRVSSVAWRPDGSEICVLWENGGSTMLSSNLTSFTTIRVEAGPHPEEEDEEEHKLKPCLWKQQEANIDPVFQDTASTSVKWPPSDAGSDDDDDDDDAHDDWLPTKSAHSHSAFKGEDLSTFLDSICISREMPGLGPIPPLRDQMLWRTLSGYQEAITISYPDQDLESGSLQILLRPGISPLHVIGSTGVSSFSQELPRRDGHEIVLMRSNAESYCQAVLTKSTIGINEPPPTLNLYLVSFNAFPRNGRYPKLVGACCHTLQKLTKYVLRSVDVMRILWKAGRRAFDQQILNVEEALSEDEVDKLDIVTALYELAMTGDCAEKVKTWITEDMGSQVCYSTFHSMPRLTCVRASPDGIQH